MNQKENKKDDDKKKYKKQPLAAGFLEGLRKEVYERLHGEGDRYPIPTHGLLLVVLSERKEIGDYLKKQYRFNEEKIKQLRGFIYDAAQRDDGKLLSRRIAMNEPWDGSDDIDSDHPTAVALRESAWDTRDPAKLEKVPDHPGDENNVDTYLGNVKKLDSIRDFAGENRYTLAEMFDELLYKVAPVIAAAMENAAAKTSRKKSK